MNDNKKACARNHTLKRGHRQNTLALVEAYGLGAWPTTTQLYTNTHIHTHTHTHQECTSRSKTSRTAQ
jgi:hypothetical protein